MPGPVLGAERLGDERKRNENMGAALWTKSGDLGQLASAVSGRDRASWGCSSPGVRAAAAWFVLISTSLKTSSASGAWFKIVEMFVSRWGWLVIQREFRSEEHVAWHSAPSQCRRGTKPQDVVGLCDALP